MKKSLRRWLWPGIWAVILGLIIYNLRRSPEWRHFDWSRLWQSMVGAEPKLLLLALVVVYATYYVRALRWKFLMEKIKVASRWVLFVGQVLGFGAIYLIGRPGEFVRPAYIAKKEDVPFTGMMAVWLLERIFDSIFLALLFSAAIGLVPADMMTSRGAGVLQRLHRGGDVMLTLTVLIVILLVAFRLRTEQFTAWLLKALRFLPEHACEHARHFLASFSDGLQAIRDWRAFLASAGLTALLWGGNATIFWLVFQSLRGELKELPWLAAGLVMFCAALGLVVQFPGIGGGYQVGVILSLTAIFAVEADVATGASIVLWLMMSAPVMVLGLVLLIHEGLSLKKLEAIAEEEQVTAGERKP
jgi:glycosyltransferase 2 family protein